MRKTLLSCLALTMTALGAWAQSWTQPQLSYTTESIPSEAYLYNVGKGMFLTKGTTWGTHASLTSDATTALLYEMQDQGDGTYKLHCAAAANTGLLGRSTEIHIYTDYKNQADWGVLYEFYRAESGCYHIRTASSSAQWGANFYDEDAPVNYGLYEMGWNPDNDDLDKNGASLGTNVGIFFLDTSLPGLELDWGFVTPEIFAVYGAQQALYDKLNEAFESGYTEAELADYAAVLTSTDIQALQQATAAVNQLILDYAYNHATPEEPCDVTSVIKNPTFEGARDAEPEGWTDEFGNMHIQNNNSYVIYDENDEITTEYGLLNFAQNWTSSNTDPIAASNIYQVITDLPQGTYLLRADCIATSGSASLTVSGAQLYAESGAIRYAVDINRNPHGSTGSGNPRRYELMITHQGGDLKIGYGFTPGYCKWFACDNFHLLYAGPVDNPGLVALSSIIEVAKPYADEYSSEYIYSDATNQQLQAELSKAYDVMSGTSDECMAQANVLTDLIATIKAEITAYKNLYTLLQRVTADAETYVDVPALGDKLAEMKDTYEAAYEDCSATVQDIEAWVQNYHDTLLQGVIAAMPSATEEQSIEVTILGTNLSWANNTDTGWTHSSTTGHWNTRAHCAEVWQSNFSCMQTIQGLPAGKYIIRAKAFCRTAANAVMSEDDPIYTVLVANANEVPVANLTTGWSEEPYYKDDDYQDPTTGLYLPNSMEGAEVAFGRGLYDNEVSTYLAKDGDLTFGIKNEGTILDNEWSIWGAFHIYYYGKSNSALYDQAVALSEQASALQDQVSLIVEAESKLNDAVAGLDNVDPTSTEAQLMQVINALEDAITYGNEGLRLLDEIMDANSYYSNINDGTITSSDEAFDDLLDEIGQAISSEEFESNEQISGWLSALPRAWTAYIQYDHLGATKDAPEDITPVIVNASFSTNDATGWTYTNTGGSIGGQDPQRIGSTAYEAWNATAFDIHQTIVGLAEGYYRLTVKALYRNGNNTPEVAAQYYAAPDSIRSLMQFYAGDASVPVQSIYQGARTMAEGDAPIDGEGSYVHDGVTYYAPNTMISFESYAMDLSLYDNELVIFVGKEQPLTLGLRYETTAANAWAPFDEFTIQYLGNGAENCPDAIEDITPSPVAPAAIYDLQGRRVTRAVRGLYIINGRKYMVK